MMEAFKSMHFQIGTAAGVVLFGWILMVVKLWKAKIAARKQKLKNEADIAARLELEPELQAARQGRTLAEAHANDFLREIDVAKELHWKLKDRANRAQQNESMLEQQVEFLQDALADANAENKANRLKLTQLSAANELNSVAIRYG